MSHLNQVARNDVQRAHKQPQFVLTLPSAQDQWQQLAWDALRFVIGQWQLGFEEVQHIMRLPHKEGFRATQEYHRGDIFQRALIADALCDVDNLLHGHLRPVINYEVDYLESCRLTSGVGGWSYFPTVPELAPDADDLGQVMQVLLRTGHREKVEEYCETPLAVLLHDNARNDGSFETWIVPATRRTPEQERQVECNKSIWGTGPDNEVMANLLYALTLYDPARFAETTQRGVTYLETRQEVNGSWASRWYYGSYYGTYVCLRLFAVARPSSPAVRPALHFLGKSQHADGGWGLDDESDPLSTSLALLGLASAQGYDNVDLRQVERALAYLQHTRESDMGWPGIRFICPRANEPYSSRTITSAYVLRAVVAWHNLTAAKT